ncbi:MAG: hypothetical protein ABJN40_01730 [Sneathiella sp.]
MRQIKKLSMVNIDPNDQGVQEGDVYLCASDVKMIMSSFNNYAGSEIWIEDNVVFVKENPKEVIQLLGLSEGESDEGS